MITPIKNTSDQRNMQFYGTGRFGHCRPANIVPVLLQGTLAFPHWIRRPTRQHFTACHWRISFSGVVEGLSGHGDVDLIAVTLGHTASWTGVDGAARPLAGPQHGPFAIVVRPIVIMAETVGTSFNEAHIEVRP